MPDVRPNTEHVGQPVSWAMHPQYTQNQRHRITLGAQQNEKMDSVSGSISSTLVTEKLDTSSDADRETTRGLSALHHSTSNDVYENAPNLTEAYGFVGAITSFVAYGIAYILYILFIYLLCIPSQYVIWAGLSSPRTAYTTLE